jgi:hypothetical protein
MNSTGLPVAMDVPAEATAAMVAAQRHELNVQALSGGAT